jgi:dolichyl-phosphate-mannose-protein mannosyltransferase
MKPPAVAVDFGGTSDTSSTSDYEEVSYPQDYNHNHNHQHNHQQGPGLPLPYTMSEEKARRRVRHNGMDGSNGDDYAYAEKDHAQVPLYDDDEGKDVYNKPRPMVNRVSSGRMPTPHMPPPTSIVCSSLYSLACDQETDIRFQKEFIWQNAEHIPPIVYTLLSCWTRYHNIGASNIVVWDEAHFGKFGSHYLKENWY